MRFATEGHFTDAVVDLAKLTGWLVHHDRGDMRQRIQGHAGFPDLVLARNGRVVMAELKTITGVLTPAQWTWQRHLGAGAPTQLTELAVTVWRPEQWDQIVKVLGG